MSEDTPTIRKRFLPPEDRVKLYEVGFDEDDILNRKKTSAMLSEIVDRIEDPLVIALDGKWGTGKSYFLQRWVGAHRLQNAGRARTVYFDAFAHDYQTDPLVALISVLAARLPQESTKLERLQAVAMKLLRPAARIGLAAGTAGASEIVGVIGDAALNQMRNEADRGLAAFWARETGRIAAMEDFRAVIAELTAPDAGKDPIPLVIVVDELDRCRPDYALEVLEVIKHFFAVPHVHFVLGANLEALENSVKARYGAGIEAAAYLQKFLSFTLNLPDQLEGYKGTPNTQVYAVETARKMGLPDEITKELIRQLAVLSRASHVSIRDVGKILSAMAVMPREAIDDQASVYEQMILITLLIVKLVRPQVFPQFLDASVSEPELVEVFDAKESHRNRVLGNGQRNPDYVRDVEHMRLFWTFICRGRGALSEADAERLERNFYFDVSDREARALPREIYENWMTTFRLSD